MISKRVEGPNPPFAEVMESVENHAREVRLLRL